MNIVCTEQKITISSEDHNTGKMNVEINIEELSSYAIEEGRDIILYYSLNYISNICMFNKLSSEVEISLSEDYPMKMNYVIGENANMCFYLAPKAAEWLSRPIIYIYMKFGAVRLTFIVIFLILVIVIFSTVSYNKDKSAGQEEGYTNFIVYLPI